MKKQIINVNYYFSVILVASMLLNSCTKLDEQVYSEIPVDEFGKNEDEVKALVGSIYITLKQHRIDLNTYLTMDGLASDMIAIPGFYGSPANPVYRETMRHTWNASSGLFEDCFFGPFQNIAICNQIYYLLENNEAIREDLKTTLLAEIRGIRAFWYYILIDHYGNVPIVSNFLDGEQPTTKPRSEVFRFIVSELNEIKDLLRSDVARVESYGKMTRGAAYTLLAKMYLNAEVWDPEGGNKWTECIAACDAVLDMPYILETWKTNFIPENHVSHEAILSAAFKADGDEPGNNTALITLHYKDPLALGLNLIPWNIVAANPAYVKSFDTTDARYAGSFLIGAMRTPTGELLLTGEGRPLIHTVDMVMNEVDPEGWGWIHEEEGARIAKWEFEPRLRKMMENDFHIFRLADVYLMKAEALLRNGGSVSEAAELVNAVRVNGLPDKLYNTVTLDDIYRERRYELAWEGFTRQDMIRFGTFLNARPPFKPNVSDPKCLLYPIPQRAIDANNKLQQNPGY